MQRSTNDPSHTHPACGAVAIALSPAGVDPGNSSAAADSESRAAALAAAAASAAAAVAVASSLDPGGSILNPASSASRLFCSASLSAALLLEVLGAVAAVEPCCLLPAVPPSMGGSSSCTFSLLLLSRLRAAFCVASSCSLDSCGMKLLLLLLSADVAPVCFCCCWVVV